MFIGDVYIKRHLIILFEPTFPVLMKVISDSLDLHTAQTELVCLRVSCTSAMILTRLHLDICWGRCENALKLAKGLLGARSNPLQRWPRQISSHTNGAAPCIRRSELRCCVRISAEESSAQRSCIAHERYQAKASQEVQKSDATTSSIRWMG